MRLIDADQLLSFIKLDERVIAPEEHTAQDIVMMIQTAPTIVQTNANVPLTLEDLRQMDGEPVWVDFPKCQEASGWMLISVSRHCVYNGLLGDCDFGNCGKNWLAYRRKPEEKTT